MYTVCYTGKLTFKSYVPLKLEKGMLFLSRRSNGEYTVFEMTYIPLNMEEYVQLNGYPVEPYIINAGNPNMLSQEYVIATPEQIGWWDEGEHTDELRTFTVEDMKFILEECDGWVDVEIEEEFDEDDKPIVILAEEKVILSSPITEESDDDEDEEYEFFFEDDEPYEQSQSFNQNNEQDDEE